LDVPPGRGDRGAVDSPARGSVGETPSRPGEYSGPPERVAYARGSSPDRYRPLREAPLRLLGSPIIHRAFALDNPKHEHPFARLAVPRLRVAVRFRRPVYLVPEL
jgi:hypothetical protein